MGNWPEAYVELEGLDVPLSAMTGQLIMLLLGKI